MRPAIRVRPPDPERERRNPPGSAEPGGFRIRNDPPTSYYRVHIEIAYTEEAKVAAIRKQLVDCYSLAMTELDRRFAGA